ncbi:MAG: helix-turn-helix domain-containing protein [Ruminococcus sp.]|nr:helix-turn-helix domain-containing protein [Ruminococcus sp.]
MIYSEKLREIREDKNLKLQDIAKLLDIDASVYGKYEREYILIPIKYLNEICNYFNISIDYILGLTNIANYKYSTKETDKIKVGMRLKDFRKENKLTQKKLAEILNTAQPVIAKYEKGINLIATPFLYTICSKYHISADYLLGKIDSPKYLK